MRIGIYLAHAPAKNPSYKQEGLGRLLAYLVKAMDKTDIRLYWQQLRGR